MKPLKLFTYIVLWKLKRIQILTSLLLLSFKNEVLPEQEQEVIPEQMFKVEIKEEYEEDEFDDHLPGKIR